MASLHFQVTVCQSLCILITFCLGIALLSVTMQYNKTEQFNIQQECPRVVPKEIYKALHILNLISKPRKRRGNRTGRKVKNGCVSLGLINARSVNCKTTLNEHVTGTNLDILAITETWLREDDYVTVSQMTPDGYKFLGIPREGRVEVLVCCIATT